MVDFGAAGAPTLDTDNNSKGIASITRTATGTFDIVLQDSYWKLLNVTGVFLAAAGAAAPTIVIADQAVGTQSGGTMTILTQNGGANTDPGDGEVLYLQITVGNSSAI